MIRRSVSPLLKETSEVFHFLKGEGKVVFYARQRDFYPYFEGLIGELAGEDGLDIHYITSDFYDPVLQGKNSGMTTYYINKLLPLFMAFVNCRVFVMSMPDLNVFHIKRSIHPVQYVYVFHSLVSTHMIYRPKAFDFYDSILCVGPHQVKEIRKRESMLGLKPKKLVKAGYYRLEKLYEAHKNYTKEDSSTTVLIAPTWGDSNLLNWCGMELIELLLNKGYKVILRLHPETVKRKTPLDIIPQANLTIETSIANMDSLVQADILITDWSGIGLKYAFGTERPVISIDTPPKVHNPEYRRLGIEPVESYLRDKIGTIVPLENIGEIPSIVQDSLNSRTAWVNRLSSLRSKYVFNFGKSSEVGAEHIKELL